MIKLGLPDGYNTGPLAEPSLTKISGNLPITTMLQRPSADGRGMVLHIFAGTTTAQAVGGNGTDP